MTGLHFPLTPTTPGSFHPCAFEDILTPLVEPALNPAYVEATGPVRVHISTYQYYCDARATYESLWPLYELLSYPCHGYLASAANGFMLPCSRRARLESRMWIKHILLWSFGYPFGT